MARIFQSIPVNVNHAGGAESSPNTIDQVAIAKTRPACARMEYGPTRRAFIYRLNKPPRSVTKRSLGRASAASRDSARVFMSTSLKKLPMPVNIPDAGIEGSWPVSANNPWPDRLLTIVEVAQWLGVSKAWVYDHVSRKRPFLPCVRLGEITRFQRADIQRFIEEHGKSNGSA